MTAALPLAVRGPRLAGRRCGSVLAVARDWRRRASGAPRRTSSRPIRVSPACSGPSRASATTPGRCRRARYDIFDEPWYIDAPAADQNLSRRVRTATPSRSTIRSCSRSRIRTSGTIPGSTSSSRGNLRLKEAEVPILREFLLRGGTLTFDDFHGPIEWANLERELKRVFPDRKIIDLPPEHPIFQLLLQVRRRSRRRPGSARSCRAAPGRRAATSRTCARSRTTTAARWC